MTEAEWLAFDNPVPMLEFLKGKANSRKMRLFACACCRRLWHRLTDERSRKAVEAAERYADGLIPHAELKRAWTEASEAYHWASEGAAAQVAMKAANPSRSGIAEDVSLFARVADSAWRTKPPERTAQATLLRELLGNPFRPVAFAPSWLAWSGACVVKLARAIYEEHRFEDLPILADALEEAGCDNADILSHLRDLGPHVRGCWVVDAILGKK